jgi:hypothetical protein
VRRAHRAAHLLVGDADAELLVDPGVVLRRSPGSRSPDALGAREGRGQQPLLYELVEVVRDRGPVEVQRLRCLVAGHRLRLAGHVVVETPPGRVVEAAQPIERLVTWRGHHHPF